MLALTASRQHYAELTHRRCQVSRRCETVLNRASGDAPWQAGDGASGQQNLQLSCCCEGIQRRNNGAAPPSRGLRSSPTRTPLVVQHQHASSTSVHCSEHASNTRGTRPGTTKKRSLGPPACSLAISPTWRQPVSVGPGPGQWQPLPRNQHRRRASETRQPTNVHTTASTPAGGWPPPHRQRRSKIVATALERLLSQTDVIVVGHHCAPRTLVMDPPPNPGPPSSSPH